MARTTRRHRVFISFHERDINYKETFVRMMGERIVDRSVNTGNIPDAGLKTATVRQTIRDEYIRDATVTIVLIGPWTWQRKHVDWEIGASLRDTQANRRCGLLGLLLPDHMSYRQREYDPRVLPPRLADNCGGEDPFALIRNWTRQVDEIHGWIHQAFLRRRRKPDPDNSRHPFGGNWRGNYRRGWQ